MKIYDCFTYFNEQELLNIRINELNNFVDYFVIVEASQTFTGKDKKFYLDDATDILSKWSDKIIRIKIDFLENIIDPWEREFFQRNAIAKVLNYADKNDIVLISDVDEIINPKVFYKINKIKKPYRLDNKQYFWNFHWQVPSHCNQGARPTVCLAKHLIDYSPQQLRSKDLPIIRDAGWHFSYFSNIENIIYKIESFAHTEYNQDEYKSLESIKHRIENGLDPFDRFPLKYYDIDKTYPLYIQENYK